MVTRSAGSVLASLSSMIVALISSRTRYSTDRQFHCAAWIESKDSMLPRSHLVTWISGRRGSTGRENACVMVFLPDVSLSVMSWTFVKRAPSSCSRLISIDPSRRIARWKGIVRRAIDDVIRRLVERGLDRFGGRRGLPLLCPHGGSPAIHVVLPGSPDRPAR